MSSIKIPPEAYGQALSLVLQLVSNHYSQRDVELTDAQIGAGLRELIANFKSTDQIIAEERARLGVEPATDATGPNGEDLDD